MSRYCSDAIAVAKVAAKGQMNTPVGVGWAMQLLDAAERELRHNINHQYVPDNCSNETFGVKPVRKEK